MPNSTMVQRYGAVAQCFHWIIAALIVTQFVFGWTAAGLPVGMHKLAVLTRHKSFGMTILMLAVLRLGWRSNHAPPPLPGAMSSVERRLARATHAAFYVLLFALPISGWLMSSAKKYSVSWFGLFTWPDLIGKSETAFDVLRTTHHGLGLVLFSIAVLHILAAFKHHFWDKDDVLLRMLPFTKTEKRS
ncbi:MAG TPA: cytochrome b [Steroidobacteraceae bacterium]|nr:cytochrome b [Steroidobacteraceae bacterium]